MLELCSLIEVKSLVRFSIYFPVIMHLFVYLSVAQMSTGFDIYHDGSSGLTFTAQAATVHFWVLPFDSESCTLIEVDSVPILIKNSGSRSLQFGST